MSLKDKLSNLSVYIQELFSNIALKIKLLIKFPHFSHVIPEPKIKKLSAIIFITLTASFFLLNLLNDFLRLQDQEIYLQHKLMQNSFSYPLHAQMAQYYLGKNTQEAKKEYFLAQKIYEETSLEGERVLGVSISPWQSWLGFENRREKIQNDLEYWQKVKMVYPEYLHAYLALAYFDNQLGNQQEAKQYLTHLLKISPLNKTAKEWLLKIR